MAPAPTTATRAPASATATRAPASATASLPSTTDAHRQPTDAYRQPIDAHFHDASVDAHVQDATADPHNLDEVVGRLERLAMAMRGRDMRAPFAQSPARDFCGDASTFNQTPASAFAQSPASTFAHTVYEEDADEPTVIDTFSPRPMHREPSSTAQPPRLNTATAPKHSISEHSPTSTSSSSSSLGVLDSRSSLGPLDSRSAVEAFLATRSRVVRVSALAGLSGLGELAPRPQSVWTHEGTKDGSVWAVFRTHEEARALLAAAPSHIAVFPALEGDLEPFSKLRRVEVGMTPPTMSVPPSPYGASFGAQGQTTYSTHAPSSTYANNGQSYADRAPSSYADHSAHASQGQRPGLVLNTAVAAQREPIQAYASQRELAQFAGQREQYAQRDSAQHTSQRDNYAPANDPAQSYAISSNPPNPRTSFRLGDWICSAAKCGAHNFGRNVACIGCGTPRVGNGLAPSPTQGHFMSARPVPSPRFAASFSAQQQQHASAFAGNSPMPQHQPSQPQNKPNHPLLTPSGRSFAVGGSVKNISSDPLSPCFMFWPDNEPFPEQGQIRPSHLSGVPPPILNTGNRGPITHQPGDWICKKCNYLNWRRRKVCQTCLPYAEGNGDSISAAVQAERIALLTNVLTQTNSQPSSANGLSPQSSAFSPSAQAFPMQQHNTMPQQQQQPMPLSVRSQSMTPPQARRPFMSSVSPPLPQGRGAVHRSKSHFDLGSYGAMGPGPVPPMPKHAATLPSGYAVGHGAMTAGHAGISRQGSPSFLAMQEAYMQPPTPSYMQAATTFKQPTTPSFMQSPTPFMPIPESASVPLLPSFLQDMVQPSPSLSPSSTSSSAELPFEEQMESAGSSRSSSRHRPRGKVSTEGLGSIWRLDRKESRSMFNPFGPEAIGWQRSQSRERVRAASQEAAHAATLESLPATMERLNI
ncbi:uncharacterized protein SCHCODRAFT_01240411 [Schizophyllum commune H4-8]|uniref:uncharacterized protein n=1 Tax=Schizophyllum commune (strain H4-8 / FGSC 9210) TaxID=578458 RepID=UPI00215E71EE|nr:uncharacterized protein SCHCODRAFT_01240411 [Schizophyllum commune H4-8]KAI5887742.1 hypothetical protein SCHCODRAFT_01240411 [Schizophyllum commune H4-8]